MCGRFVSAASPDEVARYFDALPPREPIAPSWNVAPTDDAYVVLVEDGIRRMAAHHWGLVPFWAKDPSVGSRMINARAEGLADKGAFKRAFADRRCIVPADGFYEWQKVAGPTGKPSKQPYFIHRQDGEPLAFAGLWEEWGGRSRPVSDRLRSTTVITTAANHTMAAVHDRMPVLLPASAWHRWLDPDEHDVEDLGRLLVPAPDDLLVLRPVSSAVGNVRNNGPDLVERVVPAAPVGDVVLPFDEAALPFGEPG